MIEAVLFMASTGMILSTVIALANRFLAVETDPRIEAVEEMLPGANCGGCGYSGCPAFAKAIIEESVEPGLCPVSSGDEAQRIASYTGMEPVFSEPYVALVKCCGDNTRSPERALYNGVNDCNAAINVAGATKSCQHGCLGLGSCSRACPFNAIEIDEELRIAIVHPNLCVGCGKCIESCPRDMITMVPKSAPIHILCNSPEKAPIQRKLCTRGCIGCQRCARQAPESIKMVNFLATIDYDNPPHDLSLVDTCPVDRIHTSLGIDYIPAPKKKKGAIKSLECHKVLGVAPQASEAEINKAFADKIVHYDISLIIKMDEEEQKQAIMESEKISQAYKDCLAFDPSAHTVKEGQ